MTREERDQIRDTIRQNGVTCPKNGTPPELWAINNAGEVWCPTCGYRPTIQKGNAT